MSKRKRTGNTKGDHSEASNMILNAVWDDSALMDSWDAAYEEYKYYHSIAAKGEDVEEVLKAHQMKDNNKAQPKIGAGHIEPTEVYSRPAPQLPLESIPLSHETANPTTGSYPVTEEPAISTSNSTTVPIHAPALDHIQDESLKALMMSWYYAGYYTGIYTEKQANKSTN